MKYFFLAAFFLIAKKCHHAKEPVLFESTRQNWSGGAAGSGHGINFCFYVKNSTATNYSFDSLWVDEKRLQITKSENVKGDSLLLTAEEFFHGDLQFHHQQTIDTTAEQTILFPIKNYSGAALLGYWLDGKRGYLQVKSFIQLPALNYP